MKKFEVRCKEQENHTYAIWNNDMCAWQNIPAWNGLETIDLETANQVCDSLNNLDLPRISSSFGGMGMGTF